MATILITGANRGLGLEFVRQYGQLDWDIIACSRAQSPDLTECIAAEERIQWYPLDVADHAAIDVLARQLSGRPIDVLLNNAGTYGSQPFAAGGIEHQAFGNTDFANWEQVLRINLFAPMKMAEAFVTHVAASEQKKIVTLSSMVGSMGLNDSGGMYAYRTSKAAVNMLMHSMGINLADRGILAAALHPGWARTDMGGPSADIDAAEGVAGLIKVIAGLNATDLGKLTAYNGEVLPY